MSQSCDMRRFGKLVWHDVRRLSPRNSAMGSMLLSMLAFVPLMTLFQGMTGTDTYGAGYRLTLMVLMSAIEASMVPMQLYAYVGRKQKRGDIYFAMLPASKLEKYLSIATLSLVLVPLALAVGNVLVDTLLTTVHMPFYHNYLWQTNYASIISLPALCCCALAFIGTTLGFIYANVVRNKVLRAALCFVLWIWLTGGFILPILIGGADINLNLWLIAGIQVPFVALMAVLGWNKMNKIGY